MISRRLRTLLTVAVLTSLLIACSDHRTPDITPGSSTLRQRVKSITQELPNASVAKVSLFSYDVQNRLASILTFQAPDSSIAPVELSVYQYDAQNRLIQLRREVVRRAPSYSANPVESYALKYNELGQVSGLSTGGIGLDFTYDKANRLVSSHRDFSTSGLTQDGSDKFTFAGSNLTALESYRRFSLRGPGGFLGSVDNRTFTYDDKLNPFFGNYIIPAPYPAGFRSPASSSSVITYFGGVDNVLNLSSNNVLTEVISTGTTNTYQYQYNAANLPTVRTTTTLYTKTTIEAAMTETLRFGYEGY